MNDFTKRINLIFIITGIVYVFFTGDSYATKPQDIILEATAKGTSESKAFNNALDSLAQQIYVTVKNTTEINEKLHNEKFSTAVENNTVLTSIGYFQNISTYNTKKLSKDSYEVTVGLTKQSLITTISYLFLQINLDEINNSSKAKLQEQLDIANFLFSLINYASTNNIQYDSKNIDLKMYIYNLNRILKADSQLKFLVYPKEAKAKININNNIYNSEEKVYLNRGKYYYEIKAKGFKSFNGDINLYKGDNLTLDIYLQKKLTKTIPIRIKISNKSSIEDSFIRENLQYLISQNQMQLVSDSQNYMEVSLSQRITPAITKDYNSIVIDVKIKAYIEKKEKIEQFSINNLSRGNNQKIPLSLFANQFNKKSQIFFARLFD